MSVGETSIRHRLMWLVLLSVGLSWAAMFAWSFHAARNEVFQWDETRLVQLAPLLSGLDAGDLAKLAEHGIDARNEIPHHSRSVERDSDFGDRFVHFYVIDRDGRTIARSSDFPAIDLAAYPRNAVTDVDVKGGKMAAIHRSRCPKWENHQSYGTSQRAQRPRKRRSGTHCATCSSHPSCHDGCGLG